MKQKHELITNLEELSRVIDDRAEEINVIDDADKVERIVSRLKSIMKKKKIVGLTAPQIGYNYRIFCIDFNGDIKTFINPMIVNSKGLHLSREVCVSIPKEEFIIPRSDEIIAIYQIPSVFRKETNPEHNRFIGFASDLFQQLTNLLDNIYLSDVGVKVPENFDSLSEEERTKFIDEYVDELQQLTKALNEEIENNSELKQQKDAIEFMKKVSTGEVVLEKGTIESEETDGH